MKLDILQFYYYMITDKIQFHSNKSSQYKKITAEIFTKRCVQDLDENVLTVFSKCYYISSLQKEPAWPFSLHHQPECDKDAIISSFSCNHFDCYFVYLSFVSYHAIILCLLFCSDSGEVVRKWWPLWKI